MLRSLSLAPQISGMLAELPAVHTNATSMLLLNSGRTSLLTSLCKFSTQPPNDDDKAAAGPSPSDSTPPSASSPSTNHQAQAQGAATPAPGADQQPPREMSPTLKHIHDNSALWRRWLEGKLDEKLKASDPAGAPGTSPSPRNPMRRSPQQHQRHPAAPRPLRDVVAQMGQQQQQAYPGAPPGGPQGPGGPMQPKWRPKDPSKDWKHAARVNRTVEQRVADIIVPGEGGGAGTSGGRGRYGWLGGAEDAPKISPAVSARAEETSPNRIHPHRLFFPGQTYTPDDLDPYKAKPLGERINRLFASRTIVPPKTVSQYADFRNAAFLSQFITETGKLLPRRNTKLSAKLHSRMISEVKLARSLGLMNPTERVHNLWGKGPRGPRGAQREQPAGAARAGGSGPPRVAGGEDAGASAGGLMQNDA